MSRFQFTKANLDNLKLPSVNEAGNAGYVLHWDASVGGFGIAVRPSGVVTFVLQYRTATGRQRRYKIGRYGKMTVSQARQKAIVLNGQIADGGDPASDRTATRQTLTFSEAADSYVDDWAEPKCSAEYYRSAERHAKVLANSPLGRRLVTEVMDVEVRNALKPYLNHRGTFNGLRSFISAVWTYGRRYGHIPKTCPNPVEGIEPAPSTSRARIIRPQEYAAIKAAIDTLMNERRNDPSRLLAVLFCVYTGCRPIEAVRLRRAKVDRARGVIELWEHKNIARTGNPKIFHLTPEVLTIVDRAEALHQTRTGDCDYLFHRRSNQTASNWLAKTWQSIRIRAGLNITLYQLRSGFINAACDAGHSLEAIAAVTQHMSVQTIRRHYHVVDQEKAKATAAEITGLIARYHGGKSPLDGGRE